MNLSERKVNIKNRSACEVGYTLPEGNVRRNWSPGEIKRNIAATEIEQLMFAPGGKYILNEYLLVNDQELCEYLGLQLEPEYYYDEDTVMTLLSTASIDQFYDCLNFAPQGVLDLIKSKAIEIKLNDVSKREAIKQKLGFDVTAALSNIEYANSRDEEENADKTGKRRAEPVKKVEAKPTEPQRLATPVDNKYKRI